MKAGALRAVGIALFVGAAIAALPAAAIAVTPEEFCEPRVIHDYDAPLRALPRLREPPKSGRLPFGPRRLSFRAVRETVFASIDERVVIAGDGIRYGFGLDGAAFGPKRIGWEVQSRLLRVDRDGDVRRLAKQRRQRVGLLGAPTGGDPAKPRIVGFARSPRPGLYRYEISIRNSAGRLLGRYREHYRVVPRVVDVRLTLLGSTVRVGDPVYAKVENPGTVWAAYGAGLEFDRFEGGVWARADFAALFGRPNAVPAIGILAAPGTAGSCRFNGFAVPAGMAPGLYRAVKRVGVGRKWDVTAEFTVVP